MSIFEKIREMPDNQKKIFSLIMAAALTLVIVVVWFSAGEKTSADLAEVEDSKLSSLSPMQVIKDEFSKAFSGFNDKVADLASTTDTESITSTTTDQIEITDTSTTSTRTELQIGTSTASTTISTTSEIIN